MTKQSYVYFNHVQVQFRSSCHRSGTYSYNGGHKLLAQLRKKGIILVATSNVKLFLKTIWRG